MRVAVKATLPNGYWTLGRHWPRDTQVEVEVTPEEYARIAADMHLVSVVVPEAATAIQAADTAPTQSTPKYKGK